MTSQPPPAARANDTHNVDAIALLAVIADIAIPALWDAGTHLIAEFGSPTAALAQAKATALAGAKAADRTVRKHPYLAIGLALCIGVVLAVVSIRRRTGTSD